MPLAAGSGQEVISRNISEMRHAGHPQEQAVAAAMRKSRESDAASPFGAQAPPVVDELAQFGTSPAPAQNDIGPSHVAPHPGRDPLFHGPEGNPYSDDSPLARMERQMDAFFRNTHPDAAFEGDPGKSAEARKSWLKDIEKAAREIQPKIPEAKGDAGGFSPLEQAERRLDAEQQAREQDRQMQAFGELATHECDSMEARMADYSSRLDEHDRAMQTQQQLLDAALRGGAGAGANVVSR